MFRVTCPECDGRDETCTRCEGSGKIGFRRCPQRIIDRDVVELLNAYRDYERGILPAPGGRSDQSRVFLRWVGIIGREIGAIDEEREARRKAAEA